MRNGPRNLGASGGDNGVEAGIECFLALGLGHPRITLAG